MNTTMLGEKEQKERKHENYVLHKIKSEGQKKKSKRNRPINPPIYKQHDEFFQVSKAQATKAIKIKVIQKILPLLCIPLV